MIFVPVVGWTAYRLHTPKWAVAPTSGAGAADHGGRANRPGVAALYLALEAQTAIDEYRQVSTLLRVTMFVWPCCCRVRTMAEPTMPRWPAT